MNEEKIIGALKTIKKVCEESDCTDTKCPFCIDATCCIKNNSPEEWEIKDIDELEKIKFFKEIKNEKIID